MRRFSIRHKLMALVFCIVIGSGAGITQVVSLHYSKALKKTTRADAEKTARLTALQATEKVLTNDRVGLHDLFHSQQKSNSLIRYIFLIRNGRVFAHTFPSGIPEDLLGVNRPQSENQGKIERIMSTNTGTRYIDVAWPVFGGKAGILRLGYSEAAYRKAIDRVKGRIWMITVGVLFLSLILSHLFISRLTRPLSALADAVEGIDETNLPDQLAVTSGSEIARLVNRFNQLISRLRDYTDALKTNASLLENKNRELDRVHQQTRLSFEIAKAVGEQPDLASVGAFLSKRIGDTVSCKKMALLVLGSTENRLYTGIKKRIETIDNPEAISWIKAIANQNRSPIFYSKQDVPIRIDLFRDSERIVAFPLFFQAKLLGAFSVGCSGDCHCLTNDLNIIALILNLSAGSIYRTRNREDEIRELKRKIDQSSSYGGMIGKDPRMKTIYSLIEDVAASDATILITGESGTGKEVAARAIHEKSDRRELPFLVINCSAYPETLLESELFGYEKGAFTGAAAPKPGRLEEVKGGTLFLDEIGEITTSAQVKLLRVIQSRKFERLGGEKTLSMNGRIIAATNRNLIQDVKNGRFREDLFYRLNVIPILMPPLRERRNDIPLLVTHFIDKFKQLQNKEDLGGLDPEAMRILLNYGWPGNVRELENCIEHAVVLAKGDRVLPSDLPQALQALVTGDTSASAKEPEESLRKTEKQHLIQVLDACGWNKTLAAQKLGIGRSSLYYKLKRLQIKPPADR